MDQMQNNQITMSDGYKKYAVYEIVNAMLKGKLRGKVIEVQDENFCLVVQRSWLQKKNKVWRVEKETGRTAALNMDAMAELYCRICEPRPYYSVSFQEMIEAIFEERAITAYREDGRKCVQEGEDEHLRVLWIDSSSPKVSSFSRPDLRARWYLDSKYVPVTIADFKKYGFEEDKK